MKSTLTLVGLLIGFVSNAQFAAPAGETGTTAISKDSSAIVNWANEVVTFDRGLEDIVFPAGDLASFGEADNALGLAEGTSVDVVSLGDAGSIVLSFPYPIINGVGPDFAVFENSFSNTYLELAHVEVSSDGIRFVRLPSISNIPIDTQVGSFGDTDATLIYNLAGKYRQGFGTPFDLEDIIDSTGIDLQNINFVKIIDVVGTIDSIYGSMDAEGTIINDPYSTAFESGGFDLDAVAVLNEDNPFSSIEEQSKQLFYSYPNPTTDKLYINSSNEIKTITVYNLIGEMVMNSTNNNIIDFKDASLPNGLYIVIAEDIRGNNYKTKVTYFQ